MNDWLKEIIGDSYTDEMDGKVTAALSVGALCRQGRL